MAARRKAQPTSSEEFLARIGKRIKAVRKSRGLTVDALARAMDVPLRTQFSRESGSMSMPVEELEHYARVLGCEVGELLEG